MAPDSLREMPQVRTGHENGKRSALREKDVSWEKSQMHRDVVASQKARRTVRRTKGPPEPLTTNKWCARLVFTLHLKVKALTF